ncbi:MAG: hypothetical protein R6X23_06755 [Acidimicrobiia bacterium]
MRRRLAVAGLAVLIVTVATACSSGGSGSSTGPTTTRATSAPDSSSGCEFIVASTGRRFRKAPADLQYLQTATAEPTECYDKITFTFDRGDGPDLPPGYIVEYRDPPFIEGIRSSSEGFPAAKAILYVEFRPASTSDRRFAGSPRQTYKGNLRLPFPALGSFSEGGMGHTVIVEWLDKAPPSLPEGLAPVEVTTTTAPADADPADPSPTVPADPSTTVPPVEFVPNDPAVTRVVWLIGLDRKRPFTVDSANQPSRVSVLIMR